MPLSEAEQAAEAVEREYAEWKARTRRTHVPPDMDQQMFFAFRAGRAAGDATPSEPSDGEMLDWLSSQGVAYGFENLHEGNRWSIEFDGPYPDLRAAIRAAMKGQSNG